jgi:L-aspartate oxidase
VDVRGDFLIVGSGIAGLRAAVELAGSGDIVIVTKADPNESNTEYAQGGIAAAMGPDDSPELHAADTMTAGDDLCDERAVRVLTEEGPRYTRELLEWGAAFDRDALRQPALAFEGAHSVRRVLHAGDATGREIGRVLWTRAASGARVTVLENTLAVEAIVRDGCCRGITFLNERGEPGNVLAPATLLATGGAGRVFQETTNPAVATGDGIAMAYRAGARVADMEFVQFHPTVLNVKNAPRFLLSEALRGEGARLVNASGESFMAGYHPMGDLAPRDVVARSIVYESERAGGRPVYLSLQHLDAATVRGRFPMIAATCRRFGLDLARDLIPVGPAAHYLMGGVETDLEGRTSVPGLFAAGEVACTRVHGANRLASNSLLEGLVFGARTGRAMKRGLQRAELPEPIFRKDPDTEGQRAKGKGQIMPSSPMTEQDVRRLMWQNVGLFRDETRLSDALQRLRVEQLALEESGGRPLDQLNHEGWRRANIVTVSNLIARAALRRQESRGAHFRNDFAQHDDRRWKAHVSDVTHR